VEWPFDWYFRDMKAISYYPQDPAASNYYDWSKPQTGPLPPVLITNDQTITKQGFLDATKAKYVSEKFLLRWWFPEEIYRSFTYSPLAPRPDYPGLWKPGIVPAHTDPATGKVVPAAPGDVRPTWGDTLKKAWQSISALGNAPQTTRTTQVDANGVQTTTPEPAANFWRFVALREPPHTIESYNFHLYVRKDLVREFNGIRY